ncbi:hypothetical protein CC86DRAFT_466772 [Ophiobolus disseminans]|uniref:Uncharacterized protein n=1 Tax=Ophiobolus disseminans TaxID=1469910 RepID=A0A6A7A177_9PLEO|nr:hypothetical protein CC86DRAFT_466772 [Ophiobolus disseminans]
MSDDSMMRHLERLQNFTDDVYTNADFEDVYTTYPTYPTPEAIRASPFYTQTQIHTSHSARMAMPEHIDDLYRAVHASHPIPRGKLENLGEDGLLDLGEGLEEQRWDAVRDDEFKERVHETLNRIDDLLEFRWGVHVRGSRLFSGRWPGKAVRKGNDERKEK